MADALGGMGQSGIVFAGFAMAAGGPEVSQGDELGVGNLGLQREHEAEVHEGFLDQFFMDADHAFSHEDMDVIDEAELGAAAGREGAQTVLHEVDIAPAGVDPLRYVAKQGSGVGIGGVDLAHGGPVVVELRLSASDSPEAEVFPKTGEKAGAGCCNHVGPMYQIVVRSGLVRVVPAVDSVTGWLRKSAGGPLRRNGRRRSSRRVRADGRAAWSGTTGCRRDRASSASRTRE